MTDTRHVKCCIIIIIIMLMIIMMFLCVCVQMTGRKGRVVSTKAGVQYESRSEVDVRLEILNLTEKQRFMDGEKVSDSVSLSSRLNLSFRRKFKLKLIQTFIKSCFKPKL